MKRNLLLRFSVQKKLKLHRFIRIIQLSCGISFFFVVHLFADDGYALSAAGNPDNGFLTPETEEWMQMEINQTRQVSGVITDSLGEPITGANIVEIGTTNGVISDMDGKFTISVGPNATLRISYLGYVTKTIVVGEQTTFKIVLVETYEYLDEVIVVGYGTTSPVRR